MNKAFLYTFIILPIYIDSYKNASNILNILQKKNIINNCIKNTKIFFDNNKMIKKGKKMKKSQKKLSNKNDTFVNDKKSEKEINKLKVIENYSFMVDIFLGIILTSLPIIHFYKLGKTIEKIVELICYVNGLIGFILTIYNIKIIYKDKKYNDTSSIYSYYYNLNKNISVIEEIKVIVLYDIKILLIQIINLISAILKYIDEFSIIWLLVIFLISNNLSYFC